MTDTEKALRDAIDNARRGCGGLGAWEDAATAVADAAERHLQALEWAEPEGDVETMAYWAQRILRGDAETAGGSMDLDYAHDELTKAALSYLGTDKTLAALKAEGESLVKLKEAIVEKNLEQMQAEVVAWAQRKGWYAPDEDRDTVLLKDKVNPTFGEAMALVTSEISEALEAYRDWGLEDQTKPDSYVRSALRPDALAKPEGVGSEFADVLIRLFHYAHLFGVDLRFEYERKMAYNERRAFRHGGRAL